MNNAGDLCLENIKVADNLLAGIEFEIANAYVVGYARVCSALVIGYSDNADPLTMSMPSQGVIGARTEGLTFNNVSFYNFDKANKTCIGSCSHCFFDATTDSGARTTHFNNLYFDPLTTPVKIKWDVPYKEIIHDIDGSLTRLGPNSWVCPWFPHNLQPECQGYLEEFNGIICNSSVQMRRVVFHNHLPLTMTMHPLHVLRIDDSITANMDIATMQKYYGNSDNYSNVPWRLQTDPLSSWAFPVVTGHKYKLHWGSGLDWTNMQMDISEMWTPNDLDTYLRINFTDARA